MKAGIDYIGVGVGAIIENENGQVFLSKRGPASKNERGLWEFPGGAVAFGEMMSAALIREMREEFGIEISVGRLLDVVDHILPEENQHWVSPTFLCQIIAGEPQIMEPEKSAEIGWFNLDEIPANLTKITQINLQHYQELHQ